MRNLSVITVAGTVFCTALVALGGLVERGDSRFEKLLTQAISAYREKVAEPVANESRERQLKKDINDAIYSLPSSPSAMKEAIRKVSGLSLSADAVKIFIEQQSTVQEPVARLKELDARLELMRSDFEPIKADFWNRLSEIEKNQDQVQRDAAATALSATPLGAKFHHERYEIAKLIGEREWTAMELSLLKRILDETIREKLKQ